MNDRQAREVAAEWIERHEDRQAATALYNWFANELRGMLTDDAPAAAANADGSPAVLSVSSSAMVVVRIREASQGGSRAIKVAAVSVPLGAQTRVELESTINEAGATITRERRWKFAHASEEISIETSELITGGFTEDQGPRGDEVVSRLAARACGWPLPEPPAPTRVL